MGVISDPMVLGGEAWRTASTDSHRYSKANFEAQLNRSFPNLVLEGDDTHEILDTSDIVTALLQEGQSWWKVVLKYRSHKVACGIFK